MRILIVSWHFPPSNTIAAVRMGKMARHFVDSGHEVRILSSREIEPDCSLALEIPESNVLRTDWIDIDKFIHPLTQLRNRFSRGKTTPSADRAASSTPSSEPGFWARARSRVSTFYHQLFFFPDRRIGWAPPAIRAARGLFRHWKPDIILASGPSFTAFIIAARLSRQIGVPWVAEYRDRWVDDNYFKPPPWRAFFEERLERSLIASASGIVTVSEPFAELYKAKYEIPTAVIYNGFDEHDFPDLPSPGASDEAALRLVHMGTIYPGFRDPSPLFAALANGGFDPAEIRVDFYGYLTDSLLPLVNAHGVEEFVRIIDRIPYGAAIEQQRLSDVLLLLQWNSPTEQGNVPAKLFEYFAVRRPILGMGLDDGVPASLIRRGGLGLYSNDPDEIADHLRALIAEKKAKGEIEALPPDARAGNSRKEQYTALEAFLERIRADAHSVREAGRPDPVPAAPARPTAANVQLRQGIELADIGKPDHPLLMVVVDAEEDFDWTKPFSRRGFTLESLAAQSRAQEIFRRHGIVPIYVIDYPIASDPSSVAILRDYLERGECEIGSQLHPWVNPPMIEEISLRNSYLNNLSLHLQDQKVEVLTEAIEKALRVRPRVFRSGRNGFDFRLGHLLQKHGYEVDSSVMPHTSFGYEDGPSFADFPDRPFWLDGSRRLLEIPTTRGFSGLAAALAPQVFPMISSGMMSSMHAAGILSRLGLMELIKLSPEGIDTAAHRRLVSSMLRQGHRVFSFTYHSTCLVPGSTPYVANVDQLDEFLARIDAFFAYFIGELGGRPVTALELRRMMLASESAQTLQPAVVAPAGR